MNLLTVGVVAVVAWTLIVAMALTACKAAGHADSREERRRVAPRVYFSARSRDGAKRSIR
jgi:hypothetical protein